MKKSKSAVMREIIANHQYSSFRRRSRGRKRTKKQQEDAQLLNLMRKINNTGRQARDSRPT